jgi:signal transduction histidine kinase
MGSGDVRRVTVRARREDRGLRLEVEDTGSGIPPELQASVFEPFVRGQHQSVNGTGLGLATVKRLVESHRGAVGMQSAYGRGSLFWVELPLDPDAAMPPVKAADTRL